MIERIKIAICDDHPMFRSGVAAVLKPYSNLQVVLETGSGKELLHALPKSNPHVVLLDIQMPEMDGLEICTQIRRDHPEIRIIGLSLHEQVYFITGMFKAGAGSYLLKDVHPEEMVTAIQQVHKNGYYLHDKIPVALIRQLIQMEHPSVAAVPDTGDALNERDIELLRLIAAEFTNQDIAQKLKLSPATIENYRNRLLRKTGVRNTAGLVTYAIRKGYVIV